jgi:hypothetical protein
MYLLKFAPHARRHLPALIMRSLENKKMLPGWLETYPQVDRNAAEPSPLHPPKRK